VKVLLVGNYPPDRQYSMLRFCTMLESELRRAGHAVHVVRPKARLGGSGGTERELGKWLGYIDKFILFPARLRIASKAFDVVHVCDHGNSLYTRYCGQSPCVVTCHDLLAVRRALGEFSGLRTRWSGRRYQRMIIRGLARAHQIACDSEATESDVLRVCGVPASKVSVVHVALNFPYRPASEAEKTDRLSRFGISATDQFILHVSSTSWYKNPSGVTRIMQQLAASPRARDLSFVIVSRSPTHLLRRLINECGLEPRVRVVSDVEPEDLRALYSSAVALLFPSFYEGFGWPIIEAQACGCPVFTSNRRPMTEVGGNGAIYIDPENPKDAATKILENLSHASRMREAGFANITRFSAEKMVASYLSAYAKAISSASAHYLKGRARPTPAAEPESAKWLSEPDRSPGSEELPLASKALSGETH
jgi:glycosyltransferase involved in cell wall biosynthesis